MIHLPDLYALLGLRLDATEDDIRRSYKTAALNAHPDRNRTSINNALFRCLSEAYEVLSDPERRREYDRWRGLPQPPKRVPRTTPPKTSGSAQGRAPGDVECRIDGEWVYIDGCRCIDSREKACRIRLPDGKRLWFPRAQLGHPTSEWTEGDAGEMIATVWIMQQKQKEEQAEKKQESRRPPPF